jgi:hypothetical protein
MLIVCLLSPQEMITSDSIDGSFKQLYPKHIPNDRYWHGNKACQFDQSFSSVHQQKLNLQSSDIAKNFVCLLGVCEKN